MSKAWEIAPINNGATREPIKLILDKIVSAMPTGVYDLAPTKLYKVGTTHDIPSPTNIKPKELIMTFRAIDSKKLPNSAEIKKPKQIKLPAICKTLFLPNCRYA